MYYVVDCSWSGLVPGSEAGFAVWLFNAFNAEKRIKPDIDMLCSAD